MLSGFHLALAAFLACLACTAWSAEQRSPKDPDFFPLGVYWPGEFIPRGSEGIDWRRVETLLDGLAKQHCNTIWLTHMSASEQASFSRLAAKRGIYLVASLSELDGGTEGNPAPRTTDHAAQMAAVLGAWGDAPPPIAWGLGDEPRSSFMHEMKPFAKAWSDAGQPVTVVAMAGDMPSAAKLSASFIACDIYPFFSAGNPNGPGTMSESAAYVQSAGASAYQHCKQNGKPYWFMGAAFQDPWGPYRISAEGNLVYLPGGNAHFRMPTVAEIRWQNWAALATGARGLIIFSLFYPAESMPKAPAIDKALGFGLTKETDSGLPAALLYADGRPTPQYQAMGDSFARIAKIAPILRQLEPSQGMSVFHSRGWIPSGDFVREFRDPQGELYALVVNGDITKDGVVAVTIPGGTLTVTDLTSGANLPVSRQQAFTHEPISAGEKQVLVTLPPGDGTLLRITVAKPEKP